MSDESIKELRGRIDGLNRELLAVLNKRAEVALRIAQVKRAAGRPMREPEREAEILRALVAANPGPFPAAAVQHLFTEVLKATVAMMEEPTPGARPVLRVKGQGDTRVRVGAVELGGAPVLVAGPCSVESQEQILDEARFLASRGVRLLRGGCWKPRTSPSDFQGLGRAALELLSVAAKTHGLACVTEVVDPRDVALAASYVDMVQIGARNMQNFELLREVGRARVPVLLKRGMSATVEELLYAVEYVLNEGNSQVVLCERGIRTFERATRNTFDVSAVALLRQQTHLPVLADVSHAAGRRDILAELARAALAAGAQGVMLEVHPCPALARSDSQQQLDFDGFDQFLEAVHRRLPTLDAAPAPRS